MSEFNVRLTIVHVTAGVIFDDNVQEDSVDWIWQVIDTQNGAVRIIGEKIGNVILSVHVLKNSIIRFKEVDSLWGKRYN